MCVAWNLLVCCQLSEWRDEGGKREDQKPKVACARDSGGVPEPPHPAR